MSDHPPPPPPPPPLRPLPPRLIVLPTTTDILKQTTSIFSTRNNLLTFLLLSFFLFSFRANVETTTHFLTSFIDNDPSIKPLIYRIHGPPKPTSPTSTITTRRRHYRVFGSLPKPQPNTTSFILGAFDPQFGFSNFVSDNGIRASEIVRSTPKITFRSIEILEKEESVDIVETNNSSTFNETAEIKSDSQSFLKSVNLEHHDFTALLLLIGAFCASYWLMVRAFVATYTKVHGIIFVLVLNHLCNRHNSFAITSSNGSYLGAKRLSGFIAMRWVVRDALTQLLAVLFFLSIKDRYSLLKILLRYKLMPYTTFTPWVKSFEKEIYGFLASWNLLDSIMYYVVAVGAWIAMADSRRNRREVVKESCRLLLLRIEPAIYLKYFEGVVCGISVRWVLTRHFGVLFALAFQSFMEVYFMVAWMVYYLSLKSTDANISGQTFGQRELEAMIEDDTYVHSCK